jgi:antitoxin HigA-1
MSMSLITLTTINLVVRQKKIIKSCIMNKKIKFELFNPPHAGIMFYEEIIKPNNLSIGKTSELLAIDRSYLSKIVNGRAGISHAMALKIEKVFNTPSRLWIDIQNSYDTWQAKQNTDLSKVTVFIKSSEKV